MLPVHSLGLLLFVPLVAATASTQLERLKSQINQLKQCEQGKILELLEESFSLLKVTLFKTVVVLCQQDVPLYHPRWKALYRRVWLHDHKDADAFLTPFLDEGFCEAGHMGRLFIDFLQEPLVSLNVTVNVARLSQLRRFCSLKKEQILLIRRWLPGHLPTEIKDYINQWYGLQNIQEPRWPFAETMPSTPAGVHCMATLTMHMTRACNIFVLPRPFSKAFPMRRSFVVQSERRVGMLLRGATLPLRRSLAADSMSVFLAKIAAFQQQSLGRDISFGRYDLGSGGELSLSAAGRVGVWVVLLERDEQGGISETEEVCDSMWSGQDCMSVRLTLPPNRVAVVVMGVREGLVRVEKSKLKGLLQMSELDSFDTTIRTWARMYSCRKGVPHPQAVVSWVFRH